MLSWHCNPPFTDQDQISKWIFLKPQQPPDARNVPNSQTFSDFPWKFSNSPALSSVITSVKPLWPLGVLPPSNRLQLLLDFSFFPLGVQQQSGCSERSCRTSFLLSFSFFCTSSLHFQFAVTLTSLISISVWFQSAEWKTCKMHVWIVAAFVITHSHPALLSPPCIPLSKLGSYSLTLSLLAATDPNQTDMRRFIGDACYMLHMHVRDLSAVHRGDFLPWSPTVIICSGFLCWSGKSGKGLEYLFPGEKTAMMTAQRTSGVGCPSNTLLSVNQAVNQGWVILSLHKNLARSMWTSERYCHKQ